MPSYTFQPQPNLLSMSDRLSSNVYTGLRCIGRPDQKGASLGVSGQGFAEAAADMAAIIASRGPMGPTLAFQLALRVKLASWFPIQVEICPPLGNHMGAGAHEK